MGDDTVATRVTRISAGLAVLRVMVGVVFVAHGAQKLFVFGLPGVTSAFTGMGVPLPGILAPAATVLELVGGAALVLGLFARLASMGLAVEMLGAVLLVHVRAGFFLPKGAEFALTLMAATVALALIGPGEFSLDALRGRRGTGA